MWKEEARDFIKQKILINGSVKRVYSLVRVQCGDIIRVKVEKVFGDIKRGLKSIELIKEIELIACNVQSHQYLPVSMYKIICNFLM